MSRNPRRKSPALRLLLFVQVMVLLLLLVIAFMFFKLDSIERIPLDIDSLERVELSGDFTNIALFGIDGEGRQEISGIAPGRSDSIMIMSINNRNGEVTIVSVFRDTLLEQSDGGFSKANAAYAFGGPQQAVTMLNRNLDMDIQAFITVDYDALVAMVDAVGGVYIDVQPEEVQLINEISYGISLYTGVENHAWIDEPGVQRLNGVQATGYSRIRSTVGDDFRRAERQRDVLAQIISRARTAGPVGWYRIVDNVLPMMSTNLSSWEMIRLSPNLLRIQLNEMRGWPVDVTTTRNVQGIPGDHVVPIGHAHNVRLLHEILFGMPDYEVSQRVLEINNQIVNMTGIQ